MNGSYRVALKASSVWTGVRIARLRTSAARSKGYHSSLAPIVGIVVAQLHLLKQVTSCSARDQQVAGRQQVDDGDNHLLRDSRPTGQSRT